MSKDGETIRLLRKILTDCLLLAVLVSSVLTSSLLWRPFQRGFFCGDESLMYPYKDDTVTVLMLRLVGLGLPIFTFLICEWALLRKERDDQYCLGVRIPAWVRGFYYVLSSFGIVVCFIELACNINKNTIGRLRPHFFDICVPSVNCSAAEWQGRYIEPHEYHCTGDRSDRFIDVRRSYFSGHSAWAACTMIYLALYLEKRMTWSSYRMVRHTVQFGVLMLSVFTALSRVSDNKHHWSDVIVGYCTGALFAVLMWSRGTIWVHKKDVHSPLSQFDVTSTKHPSHINIPLE